jgi:hypothetical protein
MKKSEHTEIYTLTRLAIFASLYGLSELTYGSAAKASHLSRGAIQRIFPSKSELHRQTLLHAHTLLCGYVFPPTVQTPPHYRWLDWMEGKAGLPGACVLLNALSARALTVEIHTHAWQLMDSFLQRLRLKDKETALAHAMLLSAVKGSQSSQKARAKLIQCFADQDLPVSEV